MRQFTIRLVLFLSVLLVIFGIYRLVTIRPLPPVPFFADAPDTPLIIADSAQASDAPPYTMAAFEAAQQAGAHGLYLPLWLTRDGQLIAAPSPDVSVFSAASGQIAAMTVAELAALDAGYDFDPAGAGDFSWRDRGQRLLTLPEILETFPNLRIVADLQAPELASLAALLQAVDARDARPRVLAVVDDQQLVEALRQQAPDLATAYTSGETRAFMTTERLRLTPFYRPAAPAVILPGDAVDARLARAAHGRGVAVLAEAGASVAERDRLVGIGLDGLIVPQ